MTPHASVRYTGPMEKCVRKFSSHAEAEAADRDYYLSLTPEQRMDMLLELVARLQGDAPKRLERVYRVVKREAR
jgi:hypothetical protein